MLLLWSYMSTRMKRSQLLTFLQFPPVRSHRTGLAMCPTISQLATWTTVFIVPKSSEHMQTALSLKAELQFIVAIQTMPLNPEKRPGQISQSDTVAIKVQHNSCPQDEHILSVTYLPTVRVISSMQLLILFCASKCVMLSVFSPSIATMTSPIHKLAIAALLPGVT